METVAPEPVTEPVPLAPARRLAPMRLVVAALAGLAIALAHPFPNWWPLAMPGLGVLFALWISAPTPRRAALEGFVGGALFFGVMLRWFTSVLLAFTQLGGFLSYGAVVASAIIMGAFTALVAWVLARTRRRWGAGAALALAPFLWVGFEVARQKIPFPFPWGPLSSTVAWVPGAALAATAIGSVGVSLVLAIGAALVAAARLVPRAPGRAARRAVGWVVLAVVLVVLALLARPRFGVPGVAIVVAVGLMVVAGGRGWRRPVLDAAGVWVGLLLGAVVAGVYADAHLGAAPPVRVAAVQASMGEGSNVPEEQKLHEYERLTREAARAHAALVVWPESAVSYRVDDDPTFRRWIESLAKELGVDIVVNSVTGTKGAYHNSVALVRPDTGLAQVQPKQQLVPFGEYLPLRFIFGQVPAIAWEMQEDFTPGRGPVVLHGRSADMGALVCFEAVFPGLARELARDGATVLVNTTNDSWFGTSAGPAQHMNNLLLRAPETGRPLVRAANTGISAIVDRHGRLLKQIGIGGRGVIVADVEPGRALPPGATAGRLAAILCVTVAAAALIAALFRQRTRETPDA